MEASGQSEEEVVYVLNLAYEKIRFISDDQIPFEFYRIALPYVRDVDMDDIVSVALAEYMDGLLWAGDKKLIDGLSKKGYEKMITFNQVKELLSLNN